MSGKSLFTNTILKQDIDEAYDGDHTCRLRSSGRIRRSRSSHAGWLTTCWGSAGDEDDCQEEGQPWRHRVSARVMLERTIPTNDTNVSSTGRRLHVQTHHWAFASGREASQHAGQSHGSAHAAGGCPGLPRRVGATLVGGTGATDEGRGRKRLLRVVRGEGRGAGQKEAVLGRWLAERRRAGAGVAALGALGGAAC